MLEITILLQKHIPEYVLTFIFIPAGQGSTDRSVPGPIGPQIPASGFICIDTLCLQFDSKLLSCNKFFLLQLSSIFLHYKIESSTET